MILDVLKPFNLRWMHESIKYERKQEKEGRKNKFYVSIDICFILSIIKKILELYRHIADYSCLQE